jgi:hypothetical protein
VKATGTLRRAACIAAPAIVMTAGAGCTQAARSADDVARTADDDRKTWDRGKAWDRAKTGGDVLSELDDQDGGSEDEQSE